MTSKILVVEDDRSLIGDLEAVLKQEGFEVVVARDGVEALRAVQAERPDLVFELMSVGPARMQAQQRTAWESETPGFPIIVLSAKKGQEPKKGAADAAGGDDVARLGAVKALLARIKAVQQRTSPVASLAVLRAGPIAMDLERRTVSVEGASVTLTAKEFELLRILLEAKGRVLPRGFLRENAGGHDKTYRFGTRTVDVHLGRLRRKLGSAGCYILTVRGVGYRFSILPDWL